MIYFDNSATTRPLDAVVALVSETMRESFGNASSLHTLGLDAERRIRTATSTLAAAVSSPPTSLLFTSGGTESINLALRGYLSANPRRGSHLITSAGEHPAVSETVHSLMSAGIKATVLPLEANGSIDPERLAAAIRPDTALISLIHVSNETGAIIDPEMVADIRDRINPQTAIHMDCVQSFGKLTLDTVMRRCELASFCAHKIHGPKGVGALMVRPGVRLDPILFGGGQQRGLRAGTENTALIEGFVHAAVVAKAQREQTIATVTSVREALLSAIQSRLQHHIISPGGGYPGILCIALPDLPAEVWVHALAEENIFISAGAACSSRKAKINPVLRAMGVDDLTASHAVRFSFSASNTVDEAIRAAQALLRIRQRYAKRSTNA